ncbi:carboxymuconolactone decarboxylase family protein [Corynebacterium parakroppenstedtii]|uniref:carboxymuconolactone decarboxylase family protein n=1 Tax=Corynebacterium parakroppenstedtii TaxID=2828363 RepID=UPI001C8F4680|nr:carboxymuconolactone decarboxylase family protein [Corynebacterium parakroppenstedtii]MBY0795298.1 carboxymuconolactone decarboxylase family protein [Corynebacterium parakroppenstedtii]
MSASQQDADSQPDQRHTDRSIPDVFREVFDHDYSALESSARVGDEFNQITDRFAFGEMWSAVELDDRRKILVSEACVAASGSDELSALLRAGLHLGVAVEELQEVFHQIAPYVGISPARRGLQELDKLVNAPVSNQSTVTEDDRLAKGIAAQKAMFGDGIDAMRENAPEDEGFIQDALSAYCFGDTYTRKTLSLADRELLTWVAIISLGGCDPQARAHVSGNLAVGNDRAILLGALAVCVPWIGFPRSLNALAAINSQAKNDASENDDKES